MAERRMFSRSVIDTDAFLELPLSSQALYFHLGMNADDDGFVSSPKKVLRVTTCSEEDLDNLETQGFVIPFESGVVVITHWNRNNHIQKDRYRATVYTDEKSKLHQNKSGEYSLLDTDCIQTVSEMNTQTRLGKTRLGKDSIAQPSLDRPGPAGCPSLEDVKDYFRTKGVNSELAERFFSVSREREWQIDGKPVKNWRKLADSWMNNEREGVKYDANGGGADNGGEKAGELDRRFGVVL